MNWSSSSLSSAPLLGVNIDHVATLRNARGGVYPDPVSAAQLAVEAGADIITFHLREDRRHIRDDDVQRLKATIQVPLNFESALTDEMLGLIEGIRPEHVCLVPEKRQEVTTEGGLDVSAHAARLTEACARLAASGSRVSLFIDPDDAQIDAAVAVGAPCVEFHTGAYAQAWWDQDATRMQACLVRIQAGVRRARALGLRTHAGHGLALWPHEGRSLTMHRGPSSVAVMAAQPDLVELHIGHALIGHALSVGLGQSVQDFKAEMLRAHHAALGLGERG